MALHTFMQTMISLSESGGGFHHRLGPLRAPLLAVSPRRRPRQRLRPVLPQHCILWRRQHRFGARREASPRHTRCRSCLNITQHLNTTSNETLSLWSEMELGFLLLELICMVPFDWEMIPDCKLRTEFHDVCLFPYANDSCLQLVVLVRGMYVMEGRLHCYHRNIYIFYREANWAWIHDHLIGLW